MAKDITKLLHTFIKDVYSYRDDLTIEITKTKSKKYQPFYMIHILVHIKLTDGIYSTIRKGIDRNYLRGEIKSYFNLTEDDFRVTYQNVYPIRINKTQ
jgi:hypothetical protein